MDADGFDELVNRHHGEIYRFLRRVTPRPTGAEDLTQETFLRAYRSHRTLPAEANARAWLFTIAANVARNDARSESRRQRAHAAVREIGHDGGRPGPELQTLVNEAGHALAAAITGLPLKQRLAFTLRKLHELEYEEIARSLDCSPESARANVFQALRRIRRSLNGYELPTGRDRR